MTCGEIIISVLFLLPFWESNKRKFFSLKYHIYHQFEYRNKETRCGKFAEYLNLLSITTTCLSIVYLAIILMTKNEGVKNE